jgi:hypothetical protein
MSLYRGAPYDYSATARGLVFTAGACPLGGDGRVVAPGDHEAQAVRTVENLLAALAEPRAWARRSPSQETVSGVSSSSGRSGCLILKRHRRR